MIKVFLDEKIEVLDLAVDLIFLFPIVLAKIFKVFDLLSLTK